MKGKRNICGRWLGLIVLSIVNCQLSITTAQELLNYPLDTINGEEVYVYQVEKSIGLYRIGVNFNVSQSEIIRMNPQLRERGLHYGETLYMPTKRPVEKKPAMPERAQTEVPVVPTPTPVQADSVAADKVVADSIIADSTAVTDTIVPDSRKVVDLALMLPFESQQTKRSTNAERMMEFYQGALLALRDAQNDSTLYKLHVYDSERSERKVQALCDSTELDSMKAILGLVYPIQIERMAAWCDAHQVPLVLPFSDDIELESHPQVLQFNSTDMQEADSLCQWMRSRADSTNIIVVDVREADITPVIRTLRARMRAHNLPYKGLALRDLMNDSAAYALDNTKENLFILHSDRYQHVRIILPQIVKIQEAGYKVRIVSQYSWQKEDLSLPQVYTSMFTRSEGVDAYDAQWADTYVNDHVSEAPRYDLLGYDLMRAVIGWLNGEKTHQGLQSTIEWRKVADGGYQNAILRVKN